MTRFTVAFDGDAPAVVKVGDRLQIDGGVTVRSISADLVDVRSLGDTENNWLLGEIAIDLVANRLEVSPRHVPGGDASP